MADGEVNGTINVEVLYREATGADGTGTSPTASRQPSGMSAGNITSLVRGIVNGLRPMMPQKLPTAPPKIGATGNVTNDIKNNTSNNITNNNGATNNIINNIVKEIAKEVPPDIITNNNGITNNIVKNITGEAQANQLGMPQLPASIPVDAPGSIPVVIPNIPNLNIEVPNFPELNVDIPNLPMLKVDVPTLSDLNVEIPNLPELQVNTPNLSELMVNLPTLSALEVNVPPPLAIDTTTGIPVIMPKQLTAGGSSDTSRQFNTENQRVVMDDSYETTRRNTRGAGKQRQEEPQTKPPPTHRDGRSFVPPPTQGGTMPPIPPSPPGTPTDTIDGDGEGGKAASAKKVARNIVDMTKYLKVITGAFTVGAMIKQSKVASGFLGTIAQLIGALIDVFLMPFIPLLIPLMKGLAGLVKWFMRFMDDPMGAIKEAMSGLKGIIADAVKGLIDFDWSSIFTLDFWKDIITSPNWGELLKMGVGLAGLVAIFMALTAPFKLLGALVQGAIGTVTLFVRASVALVGLAARGAILLIRGLAIASVLIMRLLGNGLMAAGNGAVVAIRLVSMAGAAAGTAAIAAIRLASIAATAAGTAALAAIRLLAGGAMGMLSPMAAGRFLPILGPAGIIIGAAALGWFGTQALMKLGEPGKVEVEKYLTDRGIDPSQLEVRPAHELRGGVSKDSPFYVEPPKKIGGVTTSSNNTGTFKPFTNLPGTTIPSNAFQTPSVVQPPGNINEGIDLVKTITDLFNSFGNVGTNSWDAVTNKADQVWEQPFIQESLAYLKDMGGLLTGFGGAEGFDGVGGEGTNGMVGLEELLKGMGGMEGLFNGRGGLTEKEWASLGSSETPKIPNVNVTVNSSFIVTPQSDGTVTIEQIETTATQNTKVKENTDSNVWLEG